MLVYSTIYYTKFAQPRYETWGFLGPYMRHAFRFPHFTSLLFCGSTGFIVAPLLAFPFFAYFTIVAYLQDFPKR